jgi:hypothetical protein
LEIGLFFYVYLVLVRKELRPNLKNPLNIFILVFLVINFLSAIFGVNVTRSIWGNFERMAGLGLSGQAATDLAALKADIEATYVTAYL